MYVHIYVLYCLYCLCYTYVLEHTRRIRRYIYMYVQIVHCIAGDCGPTLLRPSLASAKKNITRLQNPVISPYPHSRILLDESPSIRMSHLMPWSRKVLGRSIILSSCLYAWAGEPHSHITTPIIIKENHNARVHDQLKYRSILS